MTMPVMVATATAHKLTSKKGAGRGGPSVSLPELHKGAPQ